MLVVLATIAIILIIVEKSIKPLTGVSEERISQLATAIAGIEGGHAGNPGNIKDASGNIAATANLDAKLNFDFVLGLSHLYSPNMSFTQFAWMYVAGTTPGDWNKVAPGDNPDTWAAYVSGQLGVTVGSSVGEFLQS